MSADGLRLGYSFWGFLGDVKFDPAGQPLSTPDGNASYSWSILHEAQRRGWRTHLMMPDRDRPAWAQRGADVFSSFSRDMRASAYSSAWRKGDGRVFLPELDVLLVEWRFPIPGRNVGPGANQPDLEIQSRLLEHYKSRGTRVVLWDLDHKLTGLDEAWWDPDAVFETSVAPRELTRKRVRVEPPFVTGELLQHPTLPSDPWRELVYVGSRYERDDVITQYVGPVAARRPGRVEFHGNWLRDLQACERLWPGVKFHDRVTMADFRRVYGSAVACPLLAKRSYMETGFITPRIWEALLFGTIPVGFTEHRGIREYLPDELVVGSSGELGAVADRLLFMTREKRDELRRSLVERIEFMDARHFVDRVQEVVESGMGRDLAGPAQAELGQAATADGGA
jgi:hypothetical protein